MATTTHDLGNGWYLEWQRGPASEAMTFRNSEKGQRIDLLNDSVETLRAIFEEDRR